jgi:hypothetical protein
VSLLLCEGHGLLLPPPHVEAYLSGERDKLLGGLDRDRSGCVCEVTTTMHYHITSHTVKLDDAVVMLLQLRLWSLLLSQLQLPLHDTDVLTVTTVVTVLTVSC